MVLNDPEEFERVVREAWGGVGRSDPSPARLLTDTLPPRRGLKYFLGARAVKDSGRGPHSPASLSADLTRTMRGFKAGLGNRAPGVSANQYLPIQISILQSQRRGSSRKYFFDKKNPARGHGISRPLAGSNTIQGSKSKIQDPKPKIQNSRSEIHDQG